MFLKVHNLLLSLLQFSCINYMMLSNFSLIYNIYLITTKDKIDLNYDMENFKNTYLDRAAITISIVCAAQCILLPVAAITIPSFYLLPFSEEAFHNALLYLSLIHI